VPTEAFAPASVTAVFAPAAPDSGTDRSRGASVALEDGVTVSLAPAGATRVTVDGEEAPFAPVEGVLDRLDASAAVDVRPAVPLGCGFGASGAATLATALAADRAFDLDRDREALVWAAHEAEVAAGTGLGDVFVQDGGGLVVGLDDGELARSYPAETVGYDSFGGIATEDVLGDEGRMARIREAGTAALSGLSGDDLRELLEAGWAFAGETGLVTDRVADSVERVRAAGGAATMAMVGETVVGVDAGGVLADESRIATDGARLLG
jgi:pantoate kinase